MQTLKLAILFSWLTVFSCAQRPKEEKAKLNWLTLEEVTAKLQQRKKTSIDRPLHRLVRLVQGDGQTNLQYPESKRQHYYEILSR